MAGVSANRKFDFASLRTIGEVAESLDLPPHVLRFWETRFKEIDPVKRAGGRRFYRESDVELVAAIRHLLYREGYTIKGVQRILKEQGVDAVIADVRRRLAEDAAAALPPLRAIEPPPAETPPETLLSEATRRAAFDPETSNAEADIDAAPAEPSAEAPAPPPEPLFAPVVAPPAPVAPVIVVRRLDESDARVLRNALAEIEECKRLLKLTLR